MTFRSWYFIKKLNDYFKIKYHIVRYVLWHIAILFVRIASFD